MLALQTISSGTEMWKHICPEEGPMEVGIGEACSWCGETNEPKQSEENKNDNSEN